MAAGEAQEVEADRLEQHAYSGPSTSAPQHAVDSARQQRQHGPAMNWDDFIEEDDLEQGCGEDDGGPGPTGTFVTALPDQGNKRGRGEGMGQGRARKHARSSGGNGGEGKEDAEYGGFPAAGGNSAWPQNGSSRGPAAPYGRAAGPAGPSPSQRQPGAAGPGIAGVPRVHVPSAYGRQHGNRANQEQGVLPSHHQQQLLPPPRHQLQQQVSQPGRQWQPAAGPTAPQQQGMQHLHQQHGLPGPQQLHRPLNPPLAVHQQQQHQWLPSVYGAPAARDFSITATGSGTAVTGAQLGGHGSGQGTSGGGCPAFGDYVWSSGATTAGGRGAVGHAGLALVCGPQVPQHPSRQSLQLSHQQHQQQQQQQPARGSQQFQTTGLPASHPASHGAACPTQTASRDGWGGDVGSRSGDGGGCGGSGGPAHGYGGQPSAGSLQPRTVGGWGTGGGGAGSGGGGGGMWGDFIDEEAGAEWDGNNGEEDGSGGGLFVTCI
ncbi:hypothetical protein HXX76_012823 [Chlamydomonas incerta]|uniref:Uncharacterized protein n=1 Tax=Chlamydomonas incerta TaxID=51695 RepID=A0A835SJL8_CHLIN|nr:hypothetical protein HXX76_012823 [Chlamydomonas incerta]|eukprot:KAG2426766.1 hypothetical protein HXX76_012823 [Chlamydomonas incerta]